ncbi:MAG: hypothetical protein JWR68_1666 [Polaromonas sp.]|nr:hypothetical protein [Polaromonas sp.]
MPSTTPFDDITKTMKESLAKLSPGVSQEALAPVMDNLKAWSELIQAQAQTAQAAMAETVESFKNIKEPTAAVESVKALAERNMEMTVQNLKAVSALGFAQFQTNVDALQKVHPAPDAFAPVAKGLKDAALKMEDALERTMDKGRTAVKTGSKKARS